MLLTHFVIILVIVCVSMVLPFILLYFYRLSRKGKRSPLTRNLLRGPGQQLRDQIETLNDKISDYGFFVVFTPILFYLVLTLIVNKSANEQVILYGSIATVAVILIISYNKLWKTLKLRASYVLGLDGELAVGQELNNLMLQGYRVFHDFPAEKFNIDHIFFGPNGVFAVETKARMKRRIKGGGEAVKVRYDGTSLHFPGWTESGSVEQAKAQAAWLAQWLSSAVGESVDVRPVLAIPGWFLIKESPDRLLLFNGKNPELLLNSGDVILSQQLISRIAHQVEQRCRDVEPFAAPSRTS